MKTFLHKYQGCIALVLTLIVVSVVTAQNILLSDFGYETIMKSFYNNYLIFKNSFLHLISNQNLYIQYNTEQVDLYKYSPTFALFFGVFAYLPDFLGLFLWNALNGLVFYALWQIKFPSVSNKLWIWAFVLIEFITNIQSSQSNGLMAGLLILAFVFLERKNVLLATLMIVLSVYIKVFGVVAFALFLLYPDRLKAIGYAIMWTVILFIIPLVVVSPTALIAQYQNWIDLLMTDQAVAYSPSVVGWLKAWFNYTPSGMWVILVGIVLFIAPYRRIVQYKNVVFRHFMLASVLIWVVIFNHKAESPTFILAIAGVAIWFFTKKPSKTNMVLIVLAMIFTQLSPTDIFPRLIKENYLIAYVVKGVPMIFIWLKLIFDSFGLEGLSEKES